MSVSAAILVSFVPGLRIRQLPGAERKSSRTSSEAALEDGTPRSPRTSALPRNARVPGIIAFIMMEPDAGRAHKRGLF
jgi:hypothetical protein